MARAPKTGLDYFSLDVDFFTDIKIRRIKKDCGPASISILIFLLCNIYRDGGYYASWNEDLPFLTAESIGVTEGAVSEVISKALKVGFFDLDMFNRYKILTSKGIQKRFIFVVNTSKLKRFGIDEKYSLIVSSEDFQKSSEDFQKSSEELEESSEESTQRIVKNSKEKNSKVNNNATKKLIKPTLEEIQEYCVERNNSINAEYFYDYYESNGWTVGKAKMKDWKATMRNWEKRDYNNAEKVQKTDDIPDYMKNIITVDSLREQGIELPEYVPPVGFEEF